MDTLLAKQISPAPFTVREVAELSFETGQLLALGRQEHWDFRVLGQAPMPERPVRLGEWLLAPAEIDSSSIPARALSRVQTIFAAGLRPKGFVLVHEAPKLLPAPAGAGQSRPASNTLASWQVSLRHWADSPAGSLALGVAAVSGLAVFALAALSAAAVLLVPIFLLAAGSGLDPILVAVTEDGYWIEIDRWVNEPTR